MSEPINLSLPSAVDDFDLAVDTGWEFLRSSEQLNRLFYTASAASILYRGAALLPSDRTEAASTAELACPLGKLDV